MLAAVFTIPTKRMPPKFSFLILFLCLSGLAAESNKVETSIFRDKNLEGAVRKFVFEKRDNDKPLVEADVINLSTISGVALGIKDLSGLEKCRSLASLDLKGNSLTNLLPIRDLSNIQYLNLANNQIEDTASLSNITALQYIELSGNRVKDVSPLRGLTNMASLYLGSNQIKDISPLFGMRKLSSLYVEGNQIRDIKGIGALSNLMMLSLSGNKISDISPLEHVRGLYHLFLENNQIRDVAPLANAAKKDHEGEQRFTPYIHIYLKGNPLSSASKRHLTKMKEYGSRIQF
jgi:Leucine-rich repeat (LRR) protein